MSNEEEVVAVEDDADNKAVGDIEPREPRAASAYKNAVATFIGQQGRLISLHSGDPGATGASEIAGAGYTKQLTTWGPASVVVGGVNDGQSVITGSPITFTVPGNVDIKYFGVWSGTAPGTPGNFLYGKALLPGATLTSAGQVTMTPTHAYDLQ